MNVAEKRYSSTRSSVSRKSSGGGALAAADPGRAGRRGSGAPRPVPPPPRAAVWAPRPPRTIYVELERTPPRDPSDDNSDDDDKWNTSSGETDDDDEEDEDDDDYYDERPSWLSKIKDKFKLLARPKVKAILDKERSSVRFESPLPPPAAPDPADKLPHVFRPSCLHTTNSSHI